jgi:hypothetical protein
LHIPLSCSSPPVNASQLDLKAKATPSMTCLHTLPIAQCLYFNLILTKLYMWFRRKFHHSLEEEDVYWQLATFALELSMLKSQWSMHVHFHPQMDISLLCTLKPDTWINPIFSLHAYDTLKYYMCPMGLCIKGNATKKRYHSGRADTEDLHIQPSPTSPSCRFVSCSHCLQLQYGTEMTNGAVLLNQPALICKFGCSFNLPASIKNA